MTRWDALFADLEAQVTALSAADLASEVDALTRGEIAEITIADRSRAALGHDVRVGVAGALSIRGRLVGSGPDWLAMAEDGGRQALVPTAALTLVRGLPRAATPAHAAAPTDGPPVTEGPKPGAIGNRRGWRGVLRDVSRDRSPVRVHLREGSVLDATLDRVAADHADLAVHAAGEWRRARDVHDVVTVPFVAIAAIRRDQPI